MSVGSLGPATASQNHEHTPVLYHSTVILCQHKRPATQCRLAVRIRRSAPEHEQPTLRLAAAGSLASCQLLTVVSTHGEHGGANQ